MPISDVLKVTQLYTCTRTYIHTHLSIYIQYTHLKCVCVYICVCVLYSFPLWLTTEYYIQFPLPLVLSMFLSGLGTAMMITTSLLCRPTNNPTVGRDRIRKRRPWAPPPSPTHPSTASAALSSRCRCLLDAKHCVFKFPFWWEGESERQDVLGVEDEVSFNTFSCKAGNAVSSH